MQPGDILPLTYDESLVVLSLLISALGGYVALTAANRIRTLDGGVSIGYVTVAAVALGGIGIWSMHFIGMVAQVIPLRVTYDVLPTMLSLAVAVFFSGLALWFVGSAPFSTGRCAAAGMLAGLAVAGMHYLGMGSMRMDAYFEWRPGLVVLSILIAMGAATAAIWLAFNVHTEWQRMLAALVMGGAVCGMHYTGAAAGVIVCTTARGLPDAGVDTGLLPYAVFLLGVATLLVMRVEMHRTSTVRLQRAAARLEDALITRGDADR